MIKGESYAFVVKIQVSADLWDRLHDEVMERTEGESDMLDVLAEAVRAKFPKDAQGDGKVLTVRADYF